MSEIAGAASTREDSEALLREQYQSLQQQIPLLCLLMTINAGFLALVASRHMPLLTSVVIPFGLMLILGTRGVIWRMRRRRMVTIEEVRRRLRSTLWAAAILSLLFGCWGLLLFTKADTARESSIALFILVGAIGACYCLHALPAAARLVLLCGAAPVTVRMLFSGDWYLVGTGLTFLIVACVILRTQATNRSVLREVLRSRSEMGALVGALQQSQEHYRYSVDLNPQIPWLSEPDGTICEISTRWTVLTGLSVEEGMGTGWAVALHPEDLPHVLETWNHSLHSPDHPIVDLRYRLRRAEGGYRWVRARSYPRRDTQGRIVKWYGNLEDIDDQVKAELALRHAAYHDSLTGLPNRARFTQVLEQTLTAAGAYGENVGVVVIDVDSFKLINDSLGHAAGDLVLREVGVRIAEQLPSGAMVARLGGDEFAIILPQPGPPENCANVVAGLLGNVGRSMTIDEGVVEIGVSAGVAIWPDDGANAQAILKSADLALYAAKAKGARDVESFRPEMRDAIEVRKSMLREAREALSDDRVIPFYQPKICLDTGKVVGFEALLRWQHRERGLQPPQSITAAFEDAVLSVQLTDRMLDRVLADLAGWLQGGRDVGRIAVNGSPADFRRDDFAERILTRMHHFGVPASLLELEVTESVFLGQVADTVDRALHTLRAEGATIALDDFGTGYASLTHLQQFPVDVLKIDRSFVSRLDGERGADLAIVHGVIDIAQKIGVRTVAEGVENEAQLDQLCRLGCDIAQGYLFGRALSAARLPAFLDGWPTVNANPQWRAARSPDQASAAR